MPMLFLRFPIHELGDLPYVFGSFHWLLLLELELELNGLGDARSFNWNWLGVIGWILSALTGLDVYNRRSELFISIFFIF